MTGDAVNGRNGCGARAGARTLNLLAAPLNARALRALGEGAKKQVDLRRETGQPAQTTLRAQLKKLGAAGLIEKQRRNHFPGVLEYELSEAGRGLLPVIGALERWLAAAPDGELELGAPAARTAVKALADGWSTTMLRALAAKSLTLTELNGVISSLNYPSLERRLSAMRLAGLVASCEGDGRGTPCEVTDWTRRGVAPLMAAARWECCHAQTETAPLVKFDVETIFLLAARLLVAIDEVSGSCRLAVELRNDKHPVLAGLLVTVRDGVVSSQTTRLEGNPDAWVSGSLSPWLDALIERDATGLELGGDSVLARALLAGLHDAVFATAPDAL